MRENDYDLKVTLRWVLEEKASWRLVFKYNIAADWVEVEPRGPGSRGSLSAISIHTNSETEEEYQDEGKKHMKTRICRNKYFCQRWQEEEWGSESRCRCVGETEKSSSTIARTSPPELRAAGKATKR